MAVLSYPIYDTIQLSASAAQTHVLFQVGQGNGATGAFDLTNMRGSGQFPDQEKFIIERIALHLDGIAFSDDDIAGVFVQSILRVVYNNVKLIEAPAYMFSDLNAVSGVKTEASATAFDYFGQYGNGYTLKNPIPVKGGRNFRVEFYQSLAVDTANLDLKCVLDGMLDSPDISV